jgi:putative flippase GtrA
MESNAVDTMPSLGTGSPAPALADRQPASGLFLLTPARRKLLAQFLRFGIVGACGFLWDTATVYTLRHVITLTGAAILAYFVAASMNWLMNRLWTFRGTGSPGSMLRQWGTFLAANSLGFVLNRGTVLVLVHIVPICNAHPVLALMAGTLAGMFSNFTMSRRLVFR